MKKQFNRTNKRGILSGILIVGIIGSVVVAGFGGNPFQNESSTQSSTPVSSDSNGNKINSNKETDINVLRDDKVMVKNLTEWQNIDRNLKLTESLNYQYTKDKKEAENKVWKTTYSNAVEELKKSETSIQSYEKSLKKKYDSSLLEKLTLTNDIYQTKVSATRFMYEAITEKDNVKLQQVGNELEKLDELTEQAESEVPNQ